MSEVATGGHHTAAYKATYEAEEHVSGWTGWVGFAGFIMIVTGMLNILNGLVGIYRSSFYVVANHSSHLLVFPNVRTWAWINLIAGAIVLLAGISLFSGSMWARAVAVLLSIIAIIVNLVSISLYPVWSVIAITLSVLVLYSVLVHGGELKHE